MASFIVGVAGGAASGKTSVCEEIVRQLGQDELHETKRQVVIISMDSFYRELTEEEFRQAQLGEYNFDHPDAFNWDKLLATLQAVVKSEPVRVRQYDFEQRNEAPTYINVYKPDVVLLEGIYVLFDKRVREMLSLMLFVDEDSDTRLARRTLRDLKERKRDINTILRNYIRFVKPAFDDYIFPTKRHADIIIPRGHENQVAIDLIVQHIKDILSNCQVSRSDNMVSTSPKLTVFPSPQLKATIYRELDN